MRIKLLVGSCFLAVFFLAIALRGSWGSGAADDGTQFDVSLHGVSHRYHPKLLRSASSDCSYLTGRGAVEYCAPSANGDAQYSMLCSVFPMIFAGLLLALGAGTVTYVSPYRAKATAAALAAASLAAVFAGTSIAQIAMPRALQSVRRNSALHGGRRGVHVRVDRDGFALFAAALSTTSTMLRHT